MRLVDLHQGASNGEAERTGLAGLATTVDVRLYVVLPELVRGRERLLNGRHQRRPWEIIPKGTPVNVPLATAGFDINAAHRFLAATNCVRDEISHELLGLGLREGERLGLLSDVRVLGTGIHAQLAAEDLTAEGRLGEHAVHGLLDDALRMLGQHAGERSEALVAHVAGVVEVLLLR